MNIMMSDISLKVWGFFWSSGIWREGQGSQAGACVDECHDTSCSTRKIALPKEIAHVLNVQSDKLLFIAGFCGVLPFR